MTWRESLLSESSLGEVCSLVTDGTHDTPRRVTSGFPLIKAKEIVGGRIDFDNCDQISKKDHQKVIARSKPELGDTLFAHIGASLGEAAYVNTSREFSIKNIALFKPNPSVIDGRYLFYLVISPMFQALAKATKTGSAQPFLGLAQLRRHPITYHPDLKEQRRIAGVLSAFDELIENIKQRVEILEDMVRALFGEWFVEFRFPGYAAAPLVPTPDGRIPVGWKREQIGDVFTTVLGGTPSRSKREFWESGSIPWINSSKINELRVMEPSEMITPLGLQKSAAKLMPIGTTVVAITGATLGQVSYLEIETAANQSVVGIIDRSGQYNEWLYLMIKDRIAEIIQHASGGAQQHINKEIVDKVRLTLPPPAIAEKFTRIARPIFQHIAGLLRMNKNLQTTRDYVLPELIAGRALLRESKGSGLC